MKPYYMKWSSPKRLREMLGSRVLANETGNVGRKLQLERTERVALSFLNWFYQKEKPVGEQEKMHFFRLFNDATHMDSFASYIYEQCGGDAEATQRLSLLHGYLLKVCNTVIESKADDIIKHHVRTAFTTPIAAISTILRTRKSHENPS